MLSPRHTGSQCVCRVTSCVYALSARVWVERRGGDRGRGFSLVYVDDE